MAKYIIDIPDDRVCDYVGSTHLLMPYTMGEHKGHHDTGLNLTPYTKPDRKVIDLQYARDIENVARMNYNEGAKDAWEFAKKLISMSGNEVSDMIGYTTNFGEVMYNMTYQEAKAKYEEWKKQKDEIHVGDEVAYVDSDASVINCVILDKVDDDGNYYVFNENGCVGKINSKDFTETGNHYYEVVELLKKLGRI